MKGRIIVAVVPLIFLLVWLFTDFNLVMYLFILSVLVMIVSYLWSRLSTHSIEVSSRNIPTSLQAGDRFEEEITVFNRHRLPKFMMRIWERSDLLDHNNATVLTLPSRSSFTWYHEVHCHRRGQYSLGPMNVSTSDFFGIFPRQLEIGEVRQILVYPKTVELPFFESSISSVAGYGLLSQSIGQIGVSASGVRQYTTSDSYHRIHWPSTAHAGELMTKVFEIESSASSSDTYWVVLDMDQGSCLGDRVETTEEYGVTIAASLMKKYLDAGMNVGLLTSGETGCSFLPEEGSKHFQRILGALAMVKANGTKSIGKVLTENAGQFNNKSTVIIITISSNEIIDAVKHLRNQGNSVAVVLLDANSFGGTGEAVSMISRLSFMNVPAYLVRRGDNLVKTLDSRIATAYALFR